MQNQIHTLTLVKKLMIKILNLKLVILLEYQIIKTIWQKGYFPNWSEEVFMIRKIKNTSPQTYFISDLNGEKSVATFYKKNCKRQNKKNLG